MKYIKPFRWLLLGYVLFALGTLIIRFTSLKNSEWIYGGWIWIFVGPCLFALTIGGQIIALRDMRLVLINTYCKMRHIKVPIFWYFVPLISVLIIVGIVISINSSNVSKGYSEDTTLDGLEALVVMAPTFLAALKYSTKGVERVFGLKK